MRHVDGRLGKALEMLVVQLVEHNGQQNWDGEAKKQPVHVQQQGIGEHAPTIVGIEKRFKVLQSHPFAAGNAKRRLVIPKGNLHTVHGEVAEHHEKGQRRQQ